MNCGSQQARAVLRVLALILAGGRFTAPGFAAAPPGAAPETAPLVTVARQAALDRAGFSPGLIDGQCGAKTRVALREFQAAHGLAVMGTFTPQTLAALRVDTTPGTKPYQVTAADLAAIGPVPKDWKAKARLKRLPYESLTALLAERGHCTTGLLKRLNSGVALDRLKAGSAVVLPNVVPADLPSAARVEIDVGRKVVRAQDARGRTIALFHCSIARLREKLPQGATQVKAVAFDPVYQFDPQMWPEVKGVDDVLQIPPGPRNPVGLCWIDLDLPGYGIHGTPNPELIGKTGSHGCIRLTNWDAVRLGKLVRAGTPVVFVGAPAAEAPDPALRKAPGAASPRREPARTRPGAPQPALRRVQSKSLHEAGSTSVVPSAGGVDGA